MRRVQVNYKFVEILIMRVVIINGPNLNLLGIRQPEIYGTEGFDGYLEKLRERYPQVQIDFCQSNVEGELVNMLQEHGFQSDGILLNAGGYTHTSVAIADAVAAISSPVIEIHISNIFAREPERRTSLLSKYAKGIISGLGLDGYELGLRYLIEKSGV